KAPSPTIASVPVTEMGGAAAFAAGTMEKCALRDGNDAALLGKAMVNTALTSAPTSVPLNEPVGPLDGAVAVFPLQAASIRPVLMTIQFRIRVIRRSCRKKSNRPSGCPTQPVSRFAPPEAWAIRTTSRPWVHSI